MLNVSIFKVCESTLSIKQKFKKFVNFDHLLNGDTKMFLSDFGRTFKARSKEECNPVICKVCDPVQIL